MNISETVREAWLVPAFAIRELCGHIGPPILGGRHFRGLLGLLPNLQQFLVINYN